MYCTRTPGHECTILYPYSGTLDVSIRARVRLILPNMVDFSFIVSLYVSDLPNVTISTNTPVLRDMGCTVVQYRTRTAPGHWMYPYVRSSTVVPYSGTWDVLYSTRTPGHECTAPYYTRTPGHWMYPYERVRLILPYSGTWDVLSYEYSTRTPGHWMYPYVRSSTPVLRDMGCTAPVLRDMGCTVQYPYSGTLDVSVRARVRLELPYSGTWDILYSTRTVLRDIGCIRTCVVVLPYSGTWDVLYPYSGTCMYHTIPVLRDIGCIHTSAYD